MSRRPASDICSVRGIGVADIAITWTEGKSTWETRHYVTGQTLARLVLYLRYRNPNSIGHDPLGGDVGIYLVSRVCVTGLMRPGGITNRP